MSLINDALKRAKQVQQEQPARTEPGPQLRPIEARPVERNALALMLPAVALVILGLGCFVVWNSLAHKPQATTAAQFEQLSAAAPAALPTALPIESAASVATAPVAQFGNSPIVVPTTSTASAFSQRESSSAEVPSGTQAAVEAATPKPAMPKLQAIFYHPTRPSAMINGKSVFLGDKVGELRVAAIDQESITLAGGSQTNVLTLP